VTLYIDDVSNASYLTVFKFLLQLSDCSAFLIQLIVQRVGVHCLQVKDKLRRAINTPVCVTVCVTVMQ